LLFNQFGFLVIVWLNENFPFQLNKLIVVVSIPFSWVPVALPNFKELLH
jgi:hypothetical protein